MKEVWTVKKLIEKLQLIENQELEVVMEGCDCNGFWGGDIEITEGDILLCREIL